MSSRNQTRWQLAQEYELNWWKRYDNDVEWYRIFSQEVEDSVRPFLRITEETRILEIGSGPAGALTLLPSNQKFAVDPLENYFLTRKEWVQIRDPKVQYLTGKGEELPYQDDVFDLVIIDNVLDHCENPTTVLDEVHRVLKNGGFIFFRQGVYHWWGRQVRKIMEWRVIDKGHPFTFSKIQLIKYFRKYHWEIKVFKANGYLNTWLENLQNLSIKGLVKTLLFICHNRILFVLQKQNEIINTCQQS
jgi:SAM-dependent methyltransferase